MGAREQTLILIVRFYKLVVRKKKPTFITSDNKECIWLFTKSSSPCSYL